VARSQVPVCEEKEMIWVMLREMMWDSRSQLLNSQNAAWKQEPVRLVPQTRRLEEGESKRGGGRL
jgi:hypothetical protein